jgi:hypothetical protein
MKSEKSSMVFKKLNIASHKTYLIKDKTSTANKEFPSYPANKSQ